MRSCLADCCVIVVLVLWCPQDKRLCLEAGMMRHLVSGLGSRNPDGIASDSCVAPSARLSLLIFYDSLLAAGHRRPPGSELLIFCVFGCRRCHSTPYRRSPSGPRSLRNSQRWSAYRRGCARQPAGQPGGVMSDEGQQQDRCCGEEEKERPYRRKEGGVSQSIVPPPPPLCGGGGGSQPAGRRLA